MGSEGGKGKSREQRLQAALRENLKRRKAQARGRVSAPAIDQEQPATPHPAASQAAASATPDSAAPTSATPDSAIASARPKQRDSASE
jgi:hypothetical protein